MPEWCKVAASGLRSRVPFPAPPLAKIDEEYWEIVFKSII